jgi:hypothetical protein
MNLTLFFTLRSILVCMNHDAAETITAKPLIAFENPFRLPYNAAPAETAMKHSRCNPYAYKYTRGNTFKKDNPSVKQRLCPTESVIHMVLCHMKSDMKQIFSRIKYLV